MVTQDEATHRSIDKRLLLFCIIFITWSLLGLRDVFLIWFDPVPWQWGLPIYIVVHVMLAIMLVWTSGLRLWSSLLCAGGLLNCIGLPTGASYFSSDSGLGRASRSVEIENLLEAA